MRTFLFHRDVFAPEEVFATNGAVIKVTYGPHALSAAAKDRYGDLRGYLPQWLDREEVEVIEVEVARGEISKRGVRFQVADNLDLVMVVQSDGFVRTVWGNLHDDTHKSLDRSKFVQNLHQLRNLH